MSEAARSAMASTDPVDSQLGIDDGQRVVADATGAHSVEVGARSSPHVLAEIAVAADGRAGQLLLVAPRSQGTGFADLARHPECGDHHRQVSLVAEEVRVDQRSGRGVAAGEPHAAATVWQHEAESDRVTVRRTGHGRRVVRDVEEEQLDVRDRQVGVTAQHRDEIAVLARCGWNGRGGGVGDSCQRVILQTGTHPGKIDQHVDVDLPQMIGRSDTRQHQQLRGPDRPRAEDDLTIGSRSLPPPLDRVLDAAAAPARQDQPADQRVRDHGQVRPIDDRP
jgi:hypothetical protein